MAFIVLLSVAGAQEASEDEAAWFPLQVGRRWVYQVTDAQGNTFTNERRVVANKAIAGVDTFVFYEKLNNRALYLGFAGDELRLYGLASGENPTTIVTIASPPGYAPLFRFPLKTGAKVEAGRHILSNQIAFSLVMEVLSQEDESTYRVQVNFRYGRMPFTYRYWLRQGEGIIKTEAAGEGGEVFYTEELVL